MRNVAPDCRSSPERWAQRSPAADALWRAVGCLLEPKLADVVGLSAQGLGALAADVLEQRGAPLPLPYAREQRIARLAAVTAPVVLRRVCEVWDEPMLLLKGPEISARYPHHARTFVDLDLLVANAEDAQRMLLAAGFEEEDDREGIFSGIHHLTPLQLARVTAEGRNPLEAEVARGSCAAPGRSAP